MNEIKTGGMSETKSTSTTVFKTARSSMSIDCKIALADAEQRILSNPILGMKPAAANCARLMVQSIGKHRQIIVAYAYFGEFDLVVFLDAHFFYGDPAELRSELKWYGRELVHYEKEKGVELLLQLCLDQD